MRNWWDRSWMDVLREAKEKDEFRRGMLEIASQFAAVAENIECEDCGHKFKSHTPECQAERGDSWVEGVNIGAWVAMGPCLCKSFSDAGRIDLDDRLRLDSMLEQDPQSNEDTEERYS